MGNPEEIKFASPDFTEEMEARVNGNGKAFALSRGDICEQKAGVFEWEIATDLSRFSMGVCNMLGVEQSHITRGLFSVFQYIPPEEWQRLQDALAQMIQSNTPFDEQCNAIRSDGAMIRLHIKAKMTYDADGNPVLLEGTIEDITGN